MEQNKFDPFQFIGFLLISAILMFWFYDNQSNMLLNEQDIATEESLVDDLDTKSLANDNEFSTRINIDDKFEEDILKLENDNILIEINTAGAEINKILLKNYKNYTKKFLAATAAFFSSFWLIVSFCSF